MEVVELKYLRKYIPFIHYLLDNGEQNVKFKEMMGWIDQNKRFKKKIAELIEESFKVRYIKLLTNKNLPSWIHELFKEKIEFIDLESSDDDSVLLLNPDSLVDSNANTKKSESTDEKISKETIAKKTNDASISDENATKENRQIIFKPSWIHELFKDNLESIDLESSDDDSVLLLNPDSLVDSNDNTKKSESTDEKISKENIAEKTNNASTSEETTTKENRQIIFKNPAVLLKKLQPKLLEKYQIYPYNNVNKESTPLNVELVEGRKETPGDLAKSSISESKRPTTQIFLTNTDSDMTEENTVTCIICYSKPQNLTNHFVRVHKVESYVSRLTEEILNDLRNNIRIAHPVEQDNPDENESPQYTIVCAFCDEIVRDLFANFYHHFSSHTGEYGFYCSFCKLKKPYLEDMLCHQKRSRVCNAAKILTAYVYNVQHTMIYLFRCKLCNFVQLNAANIEKHILDHHGSHYDNNCIERFIIASIDGGADIGFAREETHQEKREKSQSESNLIDKYQNSLADNKMEIGVTGEESQEERSNQGIPINEDMITTFNAAVEETVTPLDESELGENYLMSIAMLNADDLKIEVEGE